MKEATHESGPLVVRRGAPWWLWVVAASFLLYFGIVLYLDFAGPVLGVVAGFAHGNVVVSRVLAQSSREAAGFHVGDRILQADGQPIASDADWFAILLNLKVGEPTIFEIQRDEQRLNLVVKPARRSFGGFGPVNAPMLALLRIGQAIMLGFACFVAFARSRNGTALLGAWFLADLAIFNPPQILTGYFAVARELPPIPLLWIPALGVQVIAPLFFTFCATFPRRLIRKPWIWMLLWMPYLVWVVPVVRLDYRMIWDPHHSTGLLPERELVGRIFLSLAYAVAGLVTMTVNYRRLADVNERRRVRVLVFGFAVGFLGSVPLVLVSQKPVLLDTAAGEMIQSVPVLTGYLILFLLAFPASFAYSILRHRVFDVRVIIRQGVQHAMARGVLLSIVPLLGALLFVDVLIRSDESLAATLKARGWIYVFLGALAGVVYQRRQQWLDQIDRRFFRDRFDTQRLLQEVIHDVKEAKRVDAAAGEVLTRIHQALHPQFIALLQREGNEEEFRSTVCIPVDHSLRVPGDGKLMTLLRLVGKPVQLSASLSLIDALPREEIQFVEEQHLELLVPIRLGSAGSESLLALGPKLSEEPYSREDQKLLSTIAASLGLLSTRAATGEPDTQSCRECPDCGACFDAAESHCRQDGSGLVRVYIPRLLRQRYRLDRRVGRGGMGTVYSGHDQALERPVAIKVIRPELVGNPDLTAKFHQEARAAAGILHPNVVTIHDFGVEHQHPFIIMELLAGGTLRTELDLGKPLSRERTLEIMNGVCSAIEEAHRRQLLHRDLKPENIFLAETPTGEVVKVLDFGLVKALSLSTSSNAPTAASTIAGTPYYMAPELLLGETATRSSDIWALGVITYEMLTGAHPFAIGNAAEWQKAVLNGRFTPVRIHFSNASPHWQLFFERVFQRDPALRTASARVFRSELELALKGQSSHT